MHEWHHQILITTIIKKKHIIISQDHFHLILVNWYFSAAKMTSINVVTNPLGPFKLVTVNTAPERAKRLIGRVAEALKEKYTILDVANVEGKPREGSKPNGTHLLTFNTEIKDVKPTVEKHRPDMLVSSCHQEQKTS
jgi:hypothetical protein